MKAIAKHNFCHNGVNYCEGCVVELDENELRALAIVGLVVIDEPSEQSKQPTSTRKKKPSQEG